MEERVIWAQDQQVTSPDLTDSQLLVEKALDRIVGEAIETGVKFRGFPCVATTTTSVTVGNGSFYKAGKVFVNDDEGGVTLNLISLLPQSAKRIVPIIVFASETDTETQPRTFLLNAVTRTTEARSTPTRHIRRANIDKVSGGTESSSPVAPAIDANYLAVAYVTLNPTGVESIAVADENELVSGRENTDAITDLNVFRKGVGVQIDTLRTDLTGLASSIYGKAPLDIVLNMARDVGALKQMASLPDVYSAYGFDPLLALAQSDTDDISVTGVTTNPLLVAKVEEGIRFADVQAQIAQMELLSLTDPTVSRADNMVMPKYTEVARVSSVGRDDEISLSQYENQTVHYTQKQVSASRTRYGTPFDLCTNSAFWRTGTYDPVTGIFTRNGQTYTAAVDTTFGGSQLQLSARNEGQVFIRFQQFWKDDYTETYWEANVVNQSINGAMIGQTFLMSQESLITSLGLFFTRAGNADVHVLLCETTKDNAPDPTNVIASITLAAADVKLWPLETRVPILPTLLKRGVRYALVFVTTGAHYLAMTISNKYAQGSLFTSTDAAWFAGDLTKDIAFNLYAAQFATPRLEVQLQYLQLPGGIVGIDLNNDVVVPSGCDISFAVKDTSNNLWRVLDEDSPGILAGLPAVVLLKAILTGTTDLMPRLGLAGRSQAKTSRPRTDFTHVSRALTPPAPVKTVTVDLRLEAFDPAHHTVLCKLLTGSGSARRTLPR